MDAANALKGSSMPIKLHGFISHNAVTLAHLLMCKAACNYSNGCFFLLNTVTLCAILHSHSGDEDGRFLGCDCTVCKNFTDVSKERTAFSLWAEYLLDVSVDPY